MQKYSFWSTFSWLYPLYKFIWLILEEIKFAKDIIIHLIIYFNLQVFWKTFNIIINFFLNIKIGFILALLNKFRIQMIRNIKLNLQFINQLDLFFSFCLVLILALNNSQDLATYNWENNNANDHNKNTNNSFESIMATDISVTYSCHRRDSEIECCRVLLIISCFVQICIG